MSAAVCVCVFIFVCSGFGCLLVLGLSEPKNVRLSSNNMNLILTWDQPEQEVSGLVYTAQYRNSVVGYRDGCVNVSSGECDFSSLNVSIYEYGTYTGRVRAETLTQRSDWTESDQLMLDRDTIIGPPSVSLYSFGDAIEVSVRDPEFRISTLRNVYNHATYNITYWKDGHKDQARSHSSIQQNRVILNDLDPRTKYCVEVRVLTEKNVKPSEPSSAVCEHTAEEEKVSWVAAFVCVVLAAAATLLVVVGVVYRKRISHFLCPKDVLPQHFKEYLLAPPKSSTFMAMRDSPPPEEIYHQVRVVADGSKPPDAT